MQKPLRAQPSSASSSKGTEDKGQQQGHPAPHDDSGGLDAFDPFHDLGDFPGILHLPSSTQIGISIELDPHTSKIQYLIELGDQHRRMIYSDSHHIFDTLMNHLLHNLAFDRH